MFISDKNSENDLEELTGETNLNKDLNIYLISNDDYLSDLKENLNNFMGMKEYYPFKHVCKG